MAYILCILKGDLHGFHGNLLYDSQDWGVGLQIQGSNYPYKYFCDKNTIKYQNIVSATLAAHRPRQFIGFDKQNNRRKIVSIFLSIF